MGVTLLLADNHRMVRTSLATALTRCGGLSIVGEASTGREAISQAVGLRPQVVIVDVRLPDCTGFAVCEAIGRRRPDSAVLLLATQDWDVDLARGFASGAAGFLAKELALSDLEAAIWRVARGEKVYSAEQRQRIQAWQADVGVHLDTLTAREAEVFEALLHGLTNLEIAQQLHISTRTVESHVTHILRKLDVADRRALRHWARRNKLMLVG